MSFKVPRFLNEHPVESFFAMALLFSLLLLGGETAPQIQPATPMTVSEKN